jgi:hypothetical protein
VAAFDDGERMLGGLLHATQTCSLDELASLVSEHGELAGLHDAVIYLADRQQEVLRPLQAHDAEGGACGGQVAGELGIDSTLAGRAFRNVEIALARIEAAESTGGPADHGLWVPLLNGTERLRVLGTRVQAVDDVVLEQARRLAAVVALLLVSKRAHSDTYAG